MTIEELDVLISKDIENIKDKNSKIKTLTDKNSEIHEVLVSDDSLDDDSTKGLQEEIEGNNEEINIKLEEIIEIINEQNKKIKKQYDDNIDKAANAARLKVNEDRIRIVREEIKKLTDSNYKYIQLTDDYDDSMNNIVKEQELLKEISEGSEISKKQDEEVEMRESGSEITDPTSTEDIDSFLENKSYLVVIDEKNDTEQLKALKAELKKLLEQIKVKNDALKSIEEAKEMLNSDELKDINIETAKDTPEQSEDTPDQSEDTPDQSDFEKASIANEDLNKQRKEHATAVLDREENVVENENLDNNDPEDIVIKNVYDQLQKSQRDIERNLNFILKSKNIPISEPNATNERKPRTLKNPQAVENRENKVEKEVKTGMLSSVSRFIGKSVKKVIGEQKFEALKDSNWYKGTVKPFQSLAKSFSSREEFHKFRKTITHNIKNATFKGTMKTLLKMGTIAGFGMALSSSAISLPLLVAGKYLATGVTTFGIEKYFQSSDITKTLENQQKFKDIFTNGDRDPKGPEKLEKLISIEMKKLQDKLNEDIELIESFSDEHVSPEQKQQDIKELYENHSINVKQIMSDINEISKMNKEEFKDFQKQTKENLKDMDFIMQSAYGGAAMSATMGAVAGGYHAIDDAYTNVIDGNNLAEQSANIQSVDEAIKINSSSVQELTSDYIDTHTMQESINLAVNNMEIASDNLQILSNYSFLSPELSNSLLNIEPTNNPFDVSTLHTLDLLDKEITTLVDKFSAGELTQAQFDQQSMALSNIYDKIGEFNNAQHDANVAAFARDDLVVKPTDSIPEATAKQYLQAMDHAKMGDGVVTPDEQSAIKTGFAILELKKQIALNELAHHSSGLSAAELASKKFEIAQMKFEDVTHADSEIFKQVHGLSNSDGLSGSALEVKLAGNQAISQLHTLSETMAEHSESISEEGIPKDMQKVVDNPLGNKTFIFWGDNNVEGVVNDIEGVDIVVQDGNSNITFSTEYEAKVETAQAEIDLAKQYVDNPNSHAEVALTQAILDAKNAAANGTTIPEGSAKILSAIDNLKDNLEIVDTHKVLETTIEKNANITNVPTTPEPAQTTPDQHSTTYNNTVGGITGGTR